MFEGKISVFDGHCDTATKLMADDTMDLGKTCGDGHVDIPRMIEGGVGAQVFACWVDPDVPAEKWNITTIKMIRRLRAAVEANSGSMGIARSGLEIERLIGEGRIAAVIGVEGGHAIGAEMDALVRLFSEGVRCMTLTWNNHNEIADACEGESCHGGLSDFGRDVIGMMDSMGMVIDLSHSSDSTFYDVLERTSNPVLVSHSCMRNICDHPRNMNDDMLRALARNGGVVGINFFPGFLENECSRETFALWNEYKRERTSLAGKYDGDVGRADGELLGRYMPKINAIKVPGVDVVVDHIEMAIDFAGIDHVGIGSDYDGTPMMPRGLEDISKMQSIAGEMRTRGYSAKETEKVMGGNLLALFKRVCTC
ncbi:MAG: dipeptidase [Candidatus Krumholzibacteria bacterium]|nr:dipeptidase [Candidatus Krumholzibacteria bacterium]